LKIIVYCCRSKCKPQ